MTTKLLRRKRRARRQAPYAWSSANHAKAASDLITAQASRGMLRIPVQRTSRTAANRRNISRSRWMNVESELATKAIRSRLHHVTLRHGADDLEEPFFLAVPRV